VTRARSLCVLIVLVAGISAAAQPTFRSGVAGVRLEVSVMNGLTPLAGLTRDNFVVIDNGVAQTIDATLIEDLPISLTLVLDTSASMRGDRIDHLVAASKRLIKALHPRDEAALLTFSEPVRLAVDVTRDQQKLLTALDGLQAAGATALNDALFLGLQLRPITVVDTTPLLLLFSDGHDNSSWLRQRQLLDAVKRSSMLLHVIELLPPDFSPNLRPSELLRDLAKAGGGRHWAAQKPSDLNDLFDKALNELRSRYLLTYSPTSGSRDGWHDVKVTLKNARGDVTARPGYFSR
jgi:Ca-activated chloride channel family protein